MGLISSTPFHKYALMNKAIAHENALERESRGGSTLPKLRPVIHHQLITDLGLHYGAKYSSRWVGLRVHTAAQTGMSTLLFLAP